MAASLSALLSHFRQAALTEREKGTYFEELIRAYFRTEPIYADLYKEVWTYADWAKAQGLDGRDTGIDLVAQTRGTEEFHAIQCKFYDEGYRIAKADIDSFFTASGQKPFTRRIIVTTTNDWTENAELALFGQNPPVTKLDLHDLDSSQIDWSKYQPAQAPVLKTKKSLRKHQTSAVQSVLAGLSKADRGKLIMACGTGKTFTSLKIAEQMVGPGGRVLFLVPSLSLLSQVLTEWTQECGIPLHSFAVCSDSEVGKKRKREEDKVETFAHELRYPATTDASRLAVEFKKRQDGTHLNVVFSTYHSIDVVSAAQSGHGLPDFDLIICDEAHRTTGATFADEDESNFVKVHDNDQIKAKKRLYMTATPRIYGDSAKALAEKENAEICSMDDVSMFGEQLHVITFSEAVSLDLLCDYKVIVLTIDEAHVSARLQDLLKSDNNDLKVDDAARIVGCWKALAKQGFEDGATDPMRRAVAFCQVIERVQGAKAHKVSSKQIAQMFSAVVEAYREKEPDSEASKLACEAEHVDGSMNASAKEAKLAWLKSEPPADTCRILSNVRCLSEGVDVPALDAVLFLTPRNSQVDVVQSVGRVMRKDPNGKKKRGYVILPVVIPAGMDPSEALNDNKVYKVVWEVLQALRSHDDRFDALINKLDLIGKDPRKMEVIAITDKVERKPGTPKKTDTGASKKKTTGAGQFTIGNPDEQPKATQAEIQFNVGELEKALYARVVKKCGNRNYWDEWARDIANIAQTHITRITTIVSNPANVKEATAFKAFADELRDDLNNSITDAEVIEMLAQHLITKPVFDALFNDYSFANNNPVSLAMQQVLDVLQEHRLEKEADTLGKFYDSVRMRASNIDNADGKQKIVIELYNKFFRNAFPRMTDRLGIVYTPIEAVDFILHSVNDLLEQEFNVSLGTEGVHVIDPFTGTGTFITRLLQSGLIPLEKLRHKYNNEIHANEIVLLAYYIAAINIEAVYHGLLKDEYKAFEGICLTDTFQLYEKEDLISHLLVDNSARRRRQKSLDIRVIIGNPPYSTGQDSANDGNQNVEYPHLDERIRETYSRDSSATLQRNLFDSYIRAFRWASDRLGQSGVLAYISGSAWLERSFADGLRASLEREFSAIYVVNLRGDVRKNMLSKGRAKEGGNIFGSDSMTGIAITFLVKRPNPSGSANIKYFDIGDDLPTEAKKSYLKEAKSIKSLIDSGLMKSIQPDIHHDWINLRDQSFSTHIPLANKAKTEASFIFSTSGPGINTSRDSWCYNFSNKELRKSIATLVEYYNSLVESQSYPCKPEDIETIVKNSDPTRINWSRSLKRDFESGKRLLASDSFVISAYRPFCKQWLYMDKSLNEAIGVMPKLFPKNGTGNIVICVSGIGARAGFSALVYNAPANFHALDSGQCFPLYQYSVPENADTSTGTLFGASAELQRTSAISDVALDHFRSRLQDISIGKDDVFYYVYGILHSEDYRARFGDNLSKELPRIPCMNSKDGFWTFSKAGRELAELHLNYEKVEPHPVSLDFGKNRLSALTAAEFRVTKMKFAPKGDKTTVIYNQYITIRGIPPQAYEYVVNGRSAPEWVMERQAVTTDKSSGIVDDPNSWAGETMEDARYPLDLFCRVITVSLKTQAIIKGLPKLDMAGDIEPSVCIPTITGTTAAQTVQKQRYFAYGSNMALSQMKSRCEAPEPVDGVARLENYRWIINSRGVATIVPSQGDYVLGRVFDLTKSDEDKLDAREPGYQKEYPMVSVQGQLSPVLVYIDPDATEGKPRAEYIGRIEAGIRDAGLPDDYVQRYILPALAH